MYNDCEVIAFHVRIYIYIGTVGDTCMLLLNKVQRSIETTTPIHVLPEGTTKTIHGTIFLQ